MAGFKEQFSTATAVWYFLNRLDRKILAESTEKTEVHFSENVITRLVGNDFSLMKDGIKLVDNNNLLLPAAWMGDASLIAYSKDGYLNRNWKLPVKFSKFKKAEIFNVTVNGLEKIGEESIKKSSLTLSLEQNQQLLIKLL